MRRSTLSHEKKKSTYETDEKKDEIGRPRTNRCCPAAEKNCTKQSNKKVLPASLEQPEPAHLLQPSCATRIDYYHNLLQIIAIAVDARCGWVARYTFLTSHFRFRRGFFCCHFLSQTPLPGINAGFTVLHIIPVVALSAWRYTLSPAVVVEAWNSV